MYKNLIPVIINKAIEFDNPEILEKFNNWEDGNYYKDRLLYCTNYNSNKCAELILTHCSELASKTNNQFINCENAVYSYIKNKDDKDLKVEKSDFDTYTKLITNHNIDLDSLAEVYYHLITLSEKHKYALDIIKNYPLAIILQKRIEQKNIEQKKKNNANNEKVNIEKNNGSATKVLGSCHSKEI